MWINVDMTGWKTPETVSPCLFIEAMYSPSSNISNLVWKWSVILTQLLSSQPIIEKLKKEIPQYLSRATRMAACERFGLVMKAAKKSVLRHIYKVLLNDS